jgi:hypothetical protein
VYEVTASIDLRAPAGYVWDVITSFGEYRDWNPVITRVQATLTKGAPMVLVVMSEGRAERIQGELLGVDHGREIAWRRPVSSASSWWLRSERHLRVVSTGLGASRFVQVERFAGLSVPFVWKRLEPDIERSFDEMNRALKARTEASLGS